MAVAEATGKEISFFPRARTGARWYGPIFFRGIGSFWVAGAPRKQS